MGVKVQACGVCAEARGLSPDEYIAGVDIVSMVDLTKSIKVSKHVLVF